MDQDQPIPFSDLEKSESYFQVKLCLSNKGLKTILKETIKVNRIKLDFFLSYILITKISEVFRKSTLS